MDLAEYLWRESKTIPQFSKQINISAPTILKIKQRRISPKLITALKIVHETDGKVSLNEIMASKDRKELSQWKVREK